jgi:hypothetical protein
LHPIRGDRKIHSFEFLQAEFDIRFSIIDEEDSYHPPAVGRDPTDSNNLRVPLRVILNHM